MSWVEFRGIPLNVWCEEFFLKLGWAVGEPLMIEEETLNREILSRGRVLILIPYGMNCPGYVKWNWKQALWFGVGRGIIQNWFGAKTGLEQIRGENIVIDLSNVGVTENNLGPSFKEALNNGDSGRTSQAEKLIHLNSTDSDFEKDLTSEPCSLSSDTSESYVSETQHVDGEVALPSSVVDNTGKSHGMKTRKDKNSISKGVEMVRKDMLTLNKDKSRWNLDVELTKVIEKSEALGHLKHQGSGEVGKKESSEESVSLPGPWIIGGDFNSAFEHSERKGGVGNERSIRNFKSFTDATNVIDLPMQGMAFTWSNNRECESWARLDRFLCDPLILSWFPQIIQKGLSCSLSDHNPVILGELGVACGPKPFHFLNGWLEDKALKEGVQKRWINCKNEKSTGLNLKQKIRTVRHHMKDVYKKNQSERNVIKEFEGELAKLEECATVNGWSIGLREKCSSILIRFWRQMRLDEQKWRQVSRVKWLKDGDRYSKYFHLLSNVRRKANFLGDNVISGKYCKGSTQVREGLLSFFKDQFK
ncbi:hypothetical protein Ddye_012434 [Dipteronia dyeriana]|uniref:DUF4283 domain-containing protein n=1 Tax=Dipteronia dyeriana TaxID=168575 RepID=A0AAD9X4B5_9ROSI|nr:hypothetical protein Ddye_012434 [Dipteronia dyeriana]